MSRRLQQVEELFHKARLLDPDQRAAFLDDACLGDPELRAEVESLLVHSDQSTSDAQITFDPVPLVDRGPLSERPGTRIGPYKLLQQIGEGGFGSVYMAEQEEPMQRRVALKIIKLGMDTKQVIARFEAERQALALMDHPNIATVLDAGATETGRPYFVMELVKGIPITEYCDKNNLSTRDRLMLFIQVCYAVLHAHQKGIIHRDLKPSNVLVTLHDSVAVPKIIDFGIAKATSRRLTERTLFTEFRQLLGTPEYMSPDQAEISALDVDTRSDIYSLGVMLYELLTGTTPLDPESLRSAGYSEMQRIIREVDPPKPSTRLVTLATERSASEIAQHHRAEPGALSRLMRGDLDWIVMRAMDKDRTRRYQSAGAFAEDIQRHLDNQPVVAGPPSVSYKFRKFVRRHRTAVTTGILVMLALAVGLTLAGIGFVRLHRETKHTHEVASFLQELFVSSDPRQAMVHDTDAEAVIATATRLFGDDHNTVAATLNSRALQLQSMGEFEAAEVLYNESLAIWRERYGADSAKTGETLRLIGVLQMMKGDNLASEEAFRESIRVTSAQPAGETLTLADTLALLGTALARRGEFDESISLLRESIRIRREIAPHQRVQIAVVINSLANILMMSGRQEELGEVLPEVLSAWKDALPPDNLMLASIRGQSAYYFLERGQLDQAEQLLNDALDVYRAAPDAPLAHYYLALDGMGGVLRRQENIAGIITLTIEKIGLIKTRGQTESLEPEQRYLESLCRRIAHMPEATASDYEIAKEGIERDIEDRPENSGSMGVLGALQYRLGVHQDALETFEQIADLALVTDAQINSSDLAFRAMALHRLGHHDEARASLEQLSERMDKTGATEDDRALWDEARTLVDNPLPAGTDE